MPNSPAEQDIPRWHRTLFSIAASMVFLLVMSGGIVCITDSSRGCPDWPVCHGRWIPPMQMNSIIEYFHRLCTPLALPFVVAAIVIAWRRYRCERWIFYPAIITVMCLLAVVVLGAFGILTGLTRFWATVDVALALLSLGSMVTAYSVVAARHRNPSLVARPSFRSNFSKLAVVTLISVYLVLVSGVLVSRPGDLMRCLNWPGIVGIWNPEDIFGWLYIVRLTFGFVSSALIVALVFQAWRNQRARPLLVRQTTVVGLLLFVGTAVGALMPTPDQGVFMPMASMATSAALWAVLVAITVQSSLSILDDTERSEK
jgi:heme A synthase